MATARKGKYPVDPVEIKASRKPFFGEGTRQSYDAKFKLNAVAFASKNSFAAASRQFGTSECNIRMWTKQQEKLKTACPKRKAFRGPRKGRFPEIDKQMLIYVNDLRDRGLPVTYDNIQMKAMEEARSLGLNRLKFKASLGWVKRFMRRNGLSLRRRTTLCQRLPKEFEEKLLSYQRHVIKLRKMHNYAISQIGNADQTPVYFDTPSTYTVEKKGAKSVIVKSTGYEKSRVTVMLAATADGWKLPPFVVLNRKTVPKDKFPAGMVVRAQHKGWMDENLVLDWIKVVWNKRPGVLFNQRGMLVLDVFKGHLTDSVKETVNKTNNDLVIIPGGMTSQLQVMDVSINKPFKDYIRQLYNDLLSEPNHELTKTGKIKKPSAAQLCEWIMSAWRQITPETIRKGFLKCCLSNAMDGSDDDVLWDQSDDEKKEETADGNNSSTEEEYEDESGSSEDE